MIDNGSSTPYSSRGHAIRVLAGVEGPLGLLVRQFLDREPEGLEWLDAWFRERAASYFRAGNPPDEVVLPEPYQHETRPRVDGVLRLISVQPHFFRGFRICPAPIDMRAGLVVVDGRNSSGKTSLAEALEFLFTGALSRREGAIEGSPTELEDCVANQLRPENEETWVAAKFVREVEGRPEGLELRRVLVQDYGPTGTSKCESTLYLNGESLDGDGEAELLDRLFGGVPPLLMQHTLRSFVQSAPAARRQYFERLLQLDDLTDLIGHAVIGEARLPDFRSPSGSVALRDWEQFESLLQQPSSASAARSLRRVPQGDEAQAVRRVLTSIATNEFSFVGDAGPDATLSTIELRVQEEQSRQRQASFPLLADLKPRGMLTRTSDEIRDFDSPRFKQRIELAWEKLDAARQAALPIGERGQVIGEVLGKLIHAHLVEPADAAQTCPLCEAGPEPTLSPDRVQTIQGWLPTIAAEQNAQQELANDVRLAQQLLRRAADEAERIVPAPPSDQHVRSARESASDELKQAVDLLLTEATTTRDALAEPIRKARELASHPVETVDDSAACSTFADACSTVLAAFGSMGNLSKAYDDRLKEVESAVGRVASDNPGYRLQERWLACSQEVEQLASDLRWESCKRQAQTDLEAIRIALIDFRSQYLEIRRQTFSAGMEQVWSDLRDEPYSSFSQLHVPSPRGRGFPVLIEVKAKLDDGDRQLEVDALKVFSESQVNALGIAAFVTRSRLLRHSILIFDDPVQSMDEDHFKTFARDVLPPLLADGIQVVLLTHNDMFARDISIWHRDREDYVTMKIVHSPSTGAEVTEGTRRVSERLKAARRTAQTEPEASWRLIRLAIERLYLIVKADSDQRFRPETWGGLPAEYMWDGGGAGVKDLVEARVPGAGRRLKEILDMSAGGVHDASARGATEIEKSVKYLNELKNQLHVEG